MSKKDDKSPHRVAELVREFFEANGNERDIVPRLKRRREIARELWKLLTPLPGGSKTREPSKEGELRFGHTEMEGADEIRAFLGERYWQIPDFDIAKHSELLAEELTAPQRQWTFEAPIPTLPGFIHMFGDHIDLGKYSLKANTDGNSHLFLFLGSVDAATHRLARAKVERVLETFFGGTVALGLAHYFRGVATSHAGWIEPPSHWRRIMIEEKPSRLSSMWEDRFSDYQLSGIFVEVPSSSVHESGENVTAAVIHSTKYAFANLLNNESPRAEVVRRACRLAFTADATADFGLFLALGFICLEGLLLADSESDVTARIAEAIAYLLANTSDQVEKIRQTVKDLYKARSKYTHQGQTSEKPAERAEMTKLIYDVLRKQIEQLSDETNRPESAL